MPDSEMFKVVLQGGSFGLLAIGVVWLLFKGGPMLRDTLTGMYKNHSDLIDQMNKDHTATVARMAAEHKEEVAALTAACREDTRAMMEWMTGEWDKRDKALDRLTAAIERFGQPKSRGGS